MLTCDARRCLCCRRLGISILVAQCECKELPCKPCWQPQYFRGRRTTERRTHTAYTRLKDDRIDEPAHLQYETAVFVRCGF